MSHTTPTLAELARRAEAELPLETGTALLRRNLFVPVARAVAAGVAGLYGQQQWIAKQISPLTCDADLLETLYVPLYLKSGRKPAKAASGTIRVSGVAGYAVLALSVWQLADGTAYTNPAEDVIPTSGLLDVQVVATIPGVAGNGETGAKLSLVNPVSGIDADAVVLAPGLSGGSDVESDDELRDRIVAVRQSGGEIGRAGDWENWALECAGVTRAWAAPQFAGFGVMTVFFVRDGDSSIYPDAAEVASVQNHLVSTGTPFGEIYARSPTRKLIDMTIRISPNTAAVRSAVQTTLKSLFAAEGAPVARDENGSTIVPVRGVTIPLYLINTSVSKTNGLDGHVLQVPAADIVCEPGEMAELGTVTWIS